MSLSLAVGAVIGLAGEIIDYFQGEKKLQFEIALKTLDEESRKSEREHERLLAQLKVAEEQAKHKSIFVSGAGAFIKWVVGIAVLLNMLLFPLFNWIALLINQEAPQIHINLQDMIKMFLPLFGIGG